MNKQRRKEIDYVIAQLSTLQSEADSLQITEGETSNLGHQQAFDAFVAGAPNRLAEAVGIIEGLRDEEQDYYDNMPEALQGGEKGDNAQAACDAMDSASSSLETAEDEVKAHDLDAFCDSVEEAVNYLEEAKG
jgi:hypothetical protein